MALGCVPPSQFGLAICGRSSYGSRPTVPTMNHPNRTESSACVPAMPPEPADDTTSPTPGPNEDQIEVEIAADWGLADPTLTPQERGLAFLDAISEPLRPPDHWQGDQLTLMGVCFYWHPELGYITIPDDGDE